MIRKRVTCIKIDRERGRERKTFASLNSRHVCWFSTSQCSLRRKQPILISIDSCLNIQSSLKSKVHQRTHTPPSYILRALYLSLSVWMELKRHVGFVVNSIDSETVSNFRFGMKFIMALISMQSNPNFQRKTELDTPELNPHSCNFDDS